MIIGVTGKSGSGKTFVSKILADRLNYKLINADEIVKKNYNKGNKFYDEIVKIFGREILNNNGEIIREKLASIIFNDFNKKEQLNAITFKYIVSEIKNNLEENSIIDAPLLFESGLDKLCNITIAVFAEEEEQIKRICKRDKITKEKALERLRAQQDDNYYKQKASYIIVNNDEESLDMQIEEIMYWITGMN